MPSAPDACKTRIFIHRYSQRRKVLPLRAWGADPKVTPARWLRALSTTSNLEFRYGLSTACGQQAPTVSMAICSRFAPCGRAQLGWSQATFASKCYAQSLRPDHATGSDLAKLPTYNIPIFCVLSHQLQC